MNAVIGAGIATLSGIDRTDVLIPTQALQGKADDRAYCPADSRPAGDDHIQRS
jgi:hypothetical protein